MGGRADIDSILEVDDIELDRVIARRGLRNFIKIAWPLIEPASPFVDNWHIGAMCEHLEAFFRSEITRLLINVPPGTMKSVTCGVASPAWVWGPAEMPEKKFIFGSYSDRVSFRDSRKTLRIVDSEWYRKRWDKFELIAKPVAKIETDKGGFRLATTVNGGVTGEHAHFQFVDDPIKPLEVSKSLTVAATAIDNCNAWWTETMSTRLMPGAGRCIIMQRLHAGDLAGEAIKEGSYVHLNLPMMYESRRKCCTVWHGHSFSDPRTEEGELLFPARFPQSEVNRLARDLGPRGTRAQLQQDPILAGGNIITLEYFRYWTQGGLPREWSFLIQSWDCTFKESDGSDFVAGQVWGAADTDGGLYNYYLLDQFCDRAGFNKTCKALQTMSLKWPKTRTKLVEAKANGNAVMDAMGDIISGLTPVEPEGGKIARVNAVEPVWAAGRVYVPHPSEYPWVSAFIDEVTGFPARNHDDQVDAMSQALIWLENKSIAKLKRAMSKVG